MVSLFEEDDDQNDEDERNSQVQKTEVCQNPKRTSHW